MKKELKVVKNRKEDRSTKKIAIFLDGTWNTSEDYTNVYALYNLCEGLEIDVDEYEAHSAYSSQTVEDMAVDQIRYYDAGVGTGSIYTPKVLGGAIGQGLRINVAQAFLMISRTYKPDDEIFVFGFSRGSYTARSVIGLLNNFGVLQKRFCKRKKRVSTPFPLLNRLINFWLHKRELKYALRAVKFYRAAAVLEADAKEVRFDRFRDQYCEAQSQNADGSVSYRVDVKFAGLWDTVGAMGIPSLLDPLGEQTKNLKLRRISRGFFRRNFMPNKVFPLNIKHACHALAIDEHRNHFTPTLWEKPTENGQCWEDSKWQSRLEQRWFIGAHSNVGGGYPDNMLSNKPLYWIYQNAKLHDLRAGAYEFNS